MHARKIKELQEEFRALGYDVKLEPKLPDLQWSPDLIARKGGKMIIVEVVSKESMPALADKLKELARYAEQKEDVRFDLVMTKPRPRRIKQGKGNVEYEIIMKMRRRMLYDAKLLIKAGKQESAFLLLFSVLESLIREVLAKNIDVEEAVTLSKTEITTRLAEDKLISKSNERLIRKMISIRNKAVHGNTSINQSMSIDILEFVSNFLRHVKSN
ncbi:MAG: hypothetical protein HYY22_02030 [Thaumarchaeota archaeon]|nr:hypothetical protein [Nitrososphaerota archaeon]